MNARHQRRKNTVFDLRILACLTLLISAAGCSAPTSRFAGRWEIDVQATHQAAQDSLGLLSRMPLADIKSRLENLSLEFSSDGRIIVSQGGRTHRERFGVIRYKDNLYRLWVTNGHRRESLSARLTNDRLWFLQGIDVIALERK
jgi:hypothetical protein